MSVVQSSRAHATTSGTSQMSQSRSRTAEVIADLFSPQYILDRIQDLEPILGDRAQAFVGVFYTQSASQMPSLLEAMAKVYIGSKHPSENDDDAGTGTSPDKAEDKEPEKDTEVPKQSSEEYKKVWRTDLEDGHCPTFVVDNLTHLLGGIGLTRFHSDHVLGPDVLYMKLMGSKATLLDLLSYATINLPAGSFPETREGLIEKLSQDVFVPKIVAA